MNARRALVKLVESVNGVYRAHTGVVGSLTCGGRTIIYPVIHFSYRPSHMLSMKILGCSVTLKMHQILFQPRLRPGPRWELTAPSNPTVLGIERFQKKSQLTEAELLPPLTQIGRSYL